MYVIFWGSNFLKKLEGIFRGSNFKKIFLECDFVGSSLEGGIFENILITA